MHCLRIALLLTVCGCGLSPGPSAATAATAASATRASLELDAPPKFPRAQPEPRAPPTVERIYEISASANAPSLGAADAKVTLEVCAELACPECAQLGATLRDLHENYGELLRIVWRHCPRAAHPQAKAAAEAALEVQAQRGSQGFWAFHDRLASESNVPDQEQLIRSAGSVEGVDAARLRTALSEHRHAAEVDAERRALSEAGASELSTPVSFVNGRLIGGAPRYEVFEDAVERALQEQPDARARAVADSKSEYALARVRHILVQYRGARAVGPGEQRTRQEAKARAELLRERIVRERIRFDKLASSESDCPSARAGGAVGSFTRGELAPELDKVLFSLQPGQVSEPVETAFGYHVLLREE